MIISLYTSMLPVIIGGVFNMLFVKIKALSFLKVPVDGGKSLNGKRIFGNSKSLLGFIGMMLGTALATIFWGIFLKQTGLEHYNLIYKNYPNTVCFNLLSGALFGFAYMIFELPNSFLKRRFDIYAGSRGRFPVNVFTFVYDQIDSMIGVMLVLAILARLSFMQYILAVIFGGITHVLVNMILILFKVRKYL